MSILRTKINTSESFEQRAFLRAAVVILYSHWEGFVKSSTKAYVEFINTQRIKYSDLKPCFLVFGAKKHLNFISQSKRHRKNSHSLSLLFLENGKIAFIDSTTNLDTESNLKSIVFDDIAFSVGLDTSQYETRYNFIDEVLLKRRNSIAHGEFLEIDVDEFNSALNDTLGLMRQYKNDILNCIEEEKYKR